MGQTEYNDALGLAGYFCLHSHVHVQISWCLQLDYDDCCDHLVGLLHNPSHDSLNESSIVYLWVPETDYF